MKRHMNSADRLALATTEDPIPLGADPLWQPAWIKPDCDISKGIFGYNLRVPIEELRHWLNLGKNY